MLRILSPPTQTRDQLAHFIPVVWRMQNQNANDDHSWGSRSPHVSRGAVGEQQHPVWTMLWMLPVLVWGWCLFPNNKIVSCSSPPLRMWVQNMNINEIKWYILHQNFICRFYFLFTESLTSVLRSLLHLKCLFKNLIWSEYSINVL